MNINIRKKTVLALGSALMLFGTALHAQEQPWSFGVKGGFSMAWLRGLKNMGQDQIGGAQATNDTSAKKSFTGGLTAGYAFHENVGVGIEVLYAGLGSTLKTSKKLPSDASDADKKNNKPNELNIYSHNIAVPVLVKLFPMGCDPEEGILTVELGPEFVFPVGVTLKKKESGQEEFKEIKGKSNKDISKDELFNLMTVGAVFGVSYEFPEIGLTLEGRYHWGLMNPLKDDTEAKSLIKDTLVLKEDKTVNTRYAAFSVGYNFARLLMD